VSKIGYDRLPEDHNDRQAVKGNSLPLPLAGEGGVRVGLQLHPPHLCPLPTGRGG
jgi:hypothetical protein